MAMHDPFRRALELVLDGTALAAAPTGRHGGNLEVIMVRRMLAARAPLAPAATFLEACAVMGAWLKDGSDAEGWQDQGPAEGWRNQGPADGWRNQGPAEGWRNQGRRRRLDL